MEVDETVLRPLRGLVNDTVKIALSYRKRNTSSRSSLVSGVTQLEQDM